MSEAVVDDIVAVLLSVFHEGVTLDVVLSSIDRAKLLKAPRLH